MKQRKSPDSSVDQYFRALTLLEDTTKYLKRAGSDANLLNTVGHLLKYLQGKTNDEIHAILGSIETQQPSADFTAEHEIEERIADLTTDQIRQILADEKVSRKDMERIARIRFGVTAGALSTLRDKKSLHNKLLTLIANEVTHDSIAKLAGVRTIPSNEKDN